MVQASGTSSLDRLKCPIVQIRNDAFLSMPRASTSNEAGGDASAGTVSGGAAPSFEQALDELENIVERMEDGSLSLDQSLAAYKRGAELVKICETALERAREQVRVLDGELLRPLSDMPARGSDRG